ncbi:glucose 1-dehydrogenase [Anaerolineales bacterium HSG25]|nr:glucose 1-dehydrogenase [Anaerolineales bacterium HSG25]
MRLKDKVAIVTGGSRGIGLATALRFAEEGAIVIAGDLEQTEELTEVINNNESYSGQVVFKRLNVADRASVNEVVASIKKEYGRIDALINNAGIVRDSRLVKMEENDFDTVIQVNLKGVYNCAQAVAPTMVEQGSGAIINASSIVAIYGNFGQTNYVASKSAVMGMTRVWARELGPKGIRVNAIAPGWIETRMTSGVPDKVIDKMMNWVPLRRMGKPRDIANAYLWLASDEATYVNGHVLSVDGGARV